MRILLVGVAGLTLASLLLSLLVWIGLRLARRRPRRFWRRVFIGHGFLVLCYTFCVIPGALGWMATRGVRTRSDEAAYSGPRLTAAGDWIAQTRRSLADEAEGKAAVPPPILADAAAHAVKLVAQDGVRLNAFLVGRRPGATGPSVVLTHGFFRGALEIEPVGRMFYELGCEVLLLELRCHGGSGGTTFTFGADESLDVVAAVRYLRSRPAHEHDPVVLFGVSIGAAAIMLAAPRIDHLAGLVLDAPMTDLDGVIGRMFRSENPSGRRRLRSSLRMPPPLPSLIVLAMESWSGISVEELRPVDALRELPPGLPALVIGGGNDDRMPPEVVRAVFAALPTTADKKEVWIREGSGHGRVWADDPDGYLEHLARFLERVAGNP